MLGRPWEGSSDGRGCDITRPCTRDSKSIHEIDDVNSHLPEQAFGINNCFGSAVILSIYASLYSPPALFASGSAPASLVHVCTLESYLVCLPPPPSEDIVAGYWSGSWDCETTTALSCLRWPCPCSLLPPSAVTLHQQHRVTALSRWLPIA